MESTDVRDRATSECSALRRDPTTAPGSGDRVPYVIVSGSKGAKARSKSISCCYCHVLKRLWRERYVR